MARILDVFSKTQNKPIPVREERTTHALRIEPQSDPGDDETSEVPFIEIGSSAGRVMSKGLQNLAPLPAILPLARPSVKLPEEATPKVTLVAPSLPYFRISFQPLPIERVDLGPAERRFARELVAFHGPDHPVSEQYRALAREMEKQLGAEPKKALLFSSAMPGSGTTSVVLNLSVTLARRDEARVAVVDANFVRPAIAGRLGVAATPGLREMLARTVPLSWAIQETGLPRLSALTNGRPSAELRLDIWPLLLDQLRQRFDWVLIDAAEWGEQPEMTVLTATCSATYLVLRQADMESDRLDELLETIPRHGGNLRGYILAQR